MFFMMVVVVVEEGGCGVCMGTLRVRAVMFLSESTIVNHRSLVAPEIPEIILVK
jgi:hypothetical protein